MSTTANKQVYNTEPPIVYSPGTGGNRIQAVKVSVPQKVVTPMVVTQSTTTYPPSPQYSQGQTQHRDDVKQGSKFCGCCCDFRRAVIIVDIIVIVLEFVVVAMIATGAIDYYISGADDNEEFEDHVDPYLKAEMGFSFVSILLCILAIAGAAKFNLWMVLPHAVWLVLGWVIGLVLVIRACNSWNEKDTKEDHSYYTIDYECTVNGPGVVFSLIFMVLFLYAHIGFMMEVNKGIMSEETYEREKHSCCCV
jgi:hypothetical protein